MPAFVFISGMLCKPRKIGQILGKYVYPYIIFQILYILFANFVLQDTQTLQFTTPYWIMWYMLALIVWSIITPLFDTKKRWQRILLLLGSVAIALLAGFDDKISYFMSMSRIVSFFPFFLAGFYFKKYTKIFTNDYKIKYHWLKAILVGLVVSLIICFIYQNIDKIDAVWLYGSYPYSVKNYSWLIRLASMCVATIFIIFLVLIVPNRKLPIITKSGGRTLSCYLLHGFVIRYLLLVADDLTIESPLAFCIISSIVLVVILTSKPIELITRPLMLWPTYWRRQHKGVANLDESGHSGGNPD